MAIRDTRRRTKRTYQKRLQARRALAAEAIARSVRILTYGKDAERKREAVREADRQ